MRFNSLDKEKPAAQKSYRGIYFMAFIGSIVLGMILASLGRLIKVAALFLIKYWYYSLVVLLILIYLKKRRKKVYVNSN